MVSPLVAKVTYVPPFGFRGNHPGGGCSGRTCAKLTHTATSLKTVLIRTNTDARAHLHVRKERIPRVCESLIQVRTLTRARTAPARTAMLNSISAFSAFSKSFLLGERYVFHGSSCIGNCARACHSSATARPIVMTGDGKYG